MDLEKTRPITFKPNDWTIPEIVREYEYMIVMEEDVDEYNQELKQKVDPDVFPIKFYGRILSKNDEDMGCFMDIGDLTSKLPICIYNKNFSKEDLDFIKGFNIGDTVGVTGELCYESGFAISVSDIQLLAKCLRPLPDKFHDPKDPELKYRQRHLHLIADKEAAKRFKSRSVMIQNIRDTLREYDFIEVETPILRGEDLRESSGLYLKRLIFAGFDKVFEIGKSFRGYSEFTTVEFYQVHANYIDSMDFIGDLFSKTVVFWSNKFRGPFLRMSVKAAVSRFYPKGKGLVGPELVEAFREHVESKLIEPTFITHFPVESFPFAKRNKLNPELTDSFKLFTNGLEIANGSSELTNPEGLKDQDLVEILEYGMPPTTGVAIEIDRLMTCVLDQPSVKDVVLFPSIGKATDV
jgi:lysyl-tRNA synthetase, class II